MNNDAQKIEKMFANLFLIVDCKSKKHGTKRASISSRNIDRFSRLFHRETRQKFCNKMIIKVSTLSGVAGDDECFYESRCRNLL